MKEQKLNRYLDQLDQSARTLQKKKEHTRAVVGCCTLVTCVIIKVQKKSCASLLRGLHPLVPSCFNYVTVLCSIHPTDHMRCASNSVMQSLNTIPLQLIGLFCMEMCL